MLERWGRVDILVNAAGGNVAGATLDPGESLFDLPEVAFREVVDLNLLGTLLPTQVFGAAMGDGGTIVNVSSMAAASAITRVVGVWPGRPFRPGHDDRRRWRFSAFSGV